MTRKTSKKKATNKARSTRVSSKKKGDKVDDAAFASAVVNMFTDEEKQEILKEHNFMLACKQAFNDIITAGNALGLKDEFDGCAIVIDKSGRYFPIAQEMFDEEIELFDDHEDDEDDDDIDPETLASDLIEYMNEAKLTQEEMAEKVGCSQATVSTWQRGDSFPSRKYHDKIAAIIYK